MVTKLLYNKYVEKVVFPLNVVRKRKIPYDN